MRIVTFCATQRGYRFIRKLVELAPDSQLVVFSFPEDAYEPPFLDDIRNLTESVGGRFIETRQVGSKRWLQFWETTDVDLMFAVSWRYMIPATVYERARLGAFVFHDSLLPKYRGFSPTVWSMINGEDHTGVTLFEIAEGVDEGNVVAQKQVPIDKDETIAQVIERVTATYLAVLTDNLPALLAGNAARYPQDHSAATYTCKLLPEDFRIDWSAPTTQIYNLIRAVTEPYSGAYTTIDGAAIRIWAAEPVSPTYHYVGRIPGRIVEVRAGEGAVVLTGDGSLAYHAHSDGRRARCRSR